MEFFLKYFLPIYFVLFLGLAVLWRSWLVWKQTSVNPFVLKNVGGVEGLVSFYFRLMPLISISVLILYLASPERYAYLGTFQWLENSVLQLLGVVLMVISLALMVCAQAQMGNSWRIGIDHQNKTEMVAQGLFLYSRNPIFLSVMVSVVGYFLVLPNALTLLCVFLDLVLIQVQIYLEEAHLSESYGEAYADYCRRVRRWL